MMQLVLLFNDLKVIIVFVEIVFLQKLHCAWVGKWEKRIQNFGYKRLFTFKNMVISSGFELKIN